MLITFDKLFKKSLQFCSGATTSVKKLTTENYFNFAVAQPQAYTFKQYLLSLKPNDRFAL